MVLAAELSKGMINEAVLQELTVGPDYYERDYPGWNHTVPYKEKTRAW